MSLVLALGLLALSGAPRQGTIDLAHEQVQTLLAERRLNDALDLVPEVGDPLLASRAEAEIYYLARDFARCIEAAQSGLSHAPDDLLLIYRALGAALWMRDGARAMSWSSRLRAAVDSASLGTEERGWWEASVVALRSDAEGLVGASAARERRVRVARGVSLALVATVLVVLVLLGRERAGDRVAGQG